MSPHRLISFALASALVAAGVIAGSSPARASHASIRGIVTDGTTGRPLADVCVTVGPPIKCFTHTDANGAYFVDLAALGQPDGLTWELWFLKQPSHQMINSENFVVDGPVTFNQVLMPVGAGLACPPAEVVPPTRSVFLPNVTKTLGGPAGWQTPFIVQNTGSTGTRLEVTFFRFLNGQCVARRAISGVQPGTSFADVPNNDPFLPGDTQFAVVVRSFGAPVVSVVNEHAGAGARAEALAYTGRERGSLSVFLPNITRRFFGYVTPFIIQNLGTSQTTASARFVSFDGTAPTVTRTRTIAAGKSQFIDPNSEPGLVDGKQYAVTVTASEPVTVVVNTHNDAASVANPVAYSTNGVTAGAAQVYGAYAAKNADGGRVSTIVVQNMGLAPVTPSLVFRRLDLTAQQVFVSPDPVQPGGAWAFDPRFTLGTTTPCATESATCLGDGEYSFIARAGDESGRIAAVVNLISPTTAMGYAASASPASRYFLPNVTRTLCACPAPAFSKGWTTPILLQSVTATTATLKWFRFSDGQLVHTQTEDIPAASAKRIDPRLVRELSDDTQFSVVVEAPGTITAIVLEMAPDGDNAMAYEGFPDISTGQTGP